MGRRPERPRPDPLAGPCVPAPDLTAFAHGELADWRRAEVSRHLLRCPACRADASGDARVLARLLALGAEGDAWRGEAVAARAALARRRRTGLLSAGAGAAAAAVLIAGFAALRAQGTGPAEGRAVASLAGPALSARAKAPPATPLSADESALLASQAPDGRWAGGAAGGDEAATGLALLALVAGRREEIRGGAVGRA